MQLYKDAGIVGKKFNSVEEFDVDDSEKSFEVENFAESDLSDPADDVDE